MIGRRNRGEYRRVDRQIVSLAVPAFLALVAEPLFLLGDSAIVGRLGTPELAGLGIASVILQTAVGLCVFLAYGTTAAVARHLGAGDQRQALALGVDGMWLAVIIGAILTIAGVAATEPLVELFGTSPEVAGFAADYLRVAFLGVVPLLLLLAATGVLRGLQDTRTPLYVAVGGNVANVGLNIVLVFGAGPVPALGIAGSAWGSVIAQSLSAAVLVGVVVRGARRHGAPLSPSRSGITAAGRSGVALVVRTLALRAAILATTYTVAAQTTSSTDLAAHQLAMTIWGFLAFVLDAVAIAAQAIVGRYLGAGDTRATREITRRMIGWGVAMGIGTGVLLGLTAFVLGPLFTADAAVHEALTSALLVAALAQPIAGVVFVLDGVLIGAGDGTYLAWASVATLVVYLPGLVLAAFLDAGLTGLWVVFAFWFMGARFAVLTWRARGDRWITTGATSGRVAA